MDSRGDQWSPSSPAIGNPNLLENSRICPDGLIRRFGRCLRARTFCRSDAWRIPFLTDSPSRGNICSSGNGAVFGAAARVPIASLVMVTEMTGGYQLLPAAGFAVLLSYLVQTQLSSHLKYSSLYEAQVLGRSQSPARYEENVRLALSVLGTRQLPKAAKVGHLDLVTLLDSGVPVNLPGRRQLNVGVLHPLSALVGKTMRSILNGVLF